MRECTRLAVEQWWRDVFDVRAELWSTLTVPVSYTHLTLPTNREV